MINELFDYENWDETCQYGDCIYYPVTLNQQLGEYPIGTKFYGAEVRISDGVVRLYDENGDTITEIKIKFQIVASN